MRALVISHIPIAATDDSGVYDALLPLRETLRSNGISFRELTGSEYGQVLEMEASRLRDVGLAIFVPNHNTIEIVGRQIELFTRRHPWITTLVALTGQLTTSQLMIPAGIEKIVLNEDPRQGISGLSAIVRAALPRFLTSRLSESSNRRTVVVQTFRTQTYRQWLSTRLFHRLGMMTACVVVAAMAWRSRDGISGAAAYLWSKLSYGWTSKFFGMLGAVAPTASVRSADVAGGMVDCCAFGGHEIREGETYVLRVVLNPTASPRQTHPEHFTDTRPLEIMALPLRPGARVRITIDSAGHLHEADESPTKRSYGDTTVATERLQDGSVHPLRKPSRSLVWQNKLEIIEFHLRLEQNSRQGMVMPRVRLHVDDMPVGSMLLELSVVNLDCWHQDEVDAIPGDYFRPNLRSTPNAVNRWQSRDQRSPMPRDTNPTMVDCSLFINTVVLPGESRALYVCLHPSSETTTLLPEFQGHSRLMTTKLKGMSLSEGDRIEFNFDGGSYVGTDYSRQDCLWQGRMEVREFRIDFPRGFPVPTLNPTLSLSINGSFIDRTIISFRSEQSAPPVRSEGVCRRVQSAEPIFVSYARKDAWRARFMMQDYKAARLDFFIDKYSIRSGAIWDRELEAALHRTNTFVLLWSHAAHASRCPTSNKLDKNAKVQWCVEEELRRAVKLAEHGRLEIDIIPFATPEHPLLFWRKSVPHLWDWARNEKRIQFSPDTIY